MKKPALISLLLSTPFLANAEAIDPSDLTKVYTQAAVMVGGDSNVKAVTMVSGNYTEQQSFAFLGEVTFGDDVSDNKFGTGYVDGRAQYFHVVQTNNSYLPSTGFSFDYIQQKSEVLDTDLFAVGALTLINPKYTPGFMVFPQAAYVTGQMDVKAFNHKEDVDGYSVAIAATAPLGDSGAFALLWPEYQNFSGDFIDVQNTNFKIGVNAPMTKSNRLWLNTRLDLGKTNFSAMGQDVSVDHSQVYMGVRYFF